MHPAPIASSGCHRAKIAVFAVLAALQACGVGPSFVRPEPPPATRYIADDVPIEQPPGTEGAQHIVLGKQIEGDWWALFGSDAIDAVVKQALEHNRTLKSASENLAQAQEMAAAQAGLRFPQVGLSAGVGRQKYGAEFLGGVFRVPPFTYFAVGPSVSYTLDYTGGIARSVEEQEAQAEVARQQLQATYLTVSGQAVMQMLNLASLSAQIATIETIIGQDRDNLRLVRSAFETGQVARIDVVSAESQIASDLSLLPPLRQELSRAHHALSLILGRTPEAALPQDLQLAEIVLPLELPVSLPSELAHRRPDILAAEASLHAATSAVGVAESNLYPKIQLTGTVGQQSPTPGGLFEGTGTAWSLLSGLTMPLFDGGTLRAERRAAVDAMRASAATYEQTVLEAFGQVADLLDALSHDAEQLAAEDQAQQAAGANLRLTREAYQEGNVGILQVLDAQRSYQQARLGFVRAEAQRYLDTVQLFLALGGSPPRTPDQSSAQTLRSGT
jgi:NodT family efflux transporter outer membrane factor (OMF) lipoprotein